MARTYSLIYEFIIHDADEQIKSSDQFSSLLFIFAISAQFCIAFIDSFLFMSAYVVRILYAAFNFFVIFY